jgi:hypothetical protein
MQLTKKSYVRLGLGRHCRSNRLFANRKQQNRYGASRRSSDNQKRQRGDRRSGHADRTTAKGRAKVGARNIGERRFLSADPDAQR